jgi:hypothetical protein
MPFFIKKLVTIEAVQWDGTKAAWDQIHAMGEIKWEPGEMGSETFSIQTIDGNWAHIHKGTWVCKGVQGEFYPCRPDIFDATYAPAR